MGIQRIRRAVLASSVILTATTGGVVLLPAPPAGAAAFLVTTTLDAGPGSLRQAILDANTSVGVPDTITFDTTTAFATPQTITLTSGELPLITDSLTITGPGVANLTILGKNSGPNQGRVFDIENTGSTTPIDVTISGLTVSAGKAADGGGIRSVDENLTLDHIEVSGNEDTGTIGGGGVFFSGAGAGLHINDSLIGNNISAANGGGLEAIVVNTSVDLLNDTFDTNDAAQDGGGIDIHLANTPTVTMTGLVVSTNQAGSAASPAPPGHGGGINVDATNTTGTAPLTIVNSAITGNSADLEAGLGIGGGVAFVGSGTPNFVGADISHSTLSGNTAGAGGGVYADSSDPLIEDTTMTANAATTSAPATGGGALTADTSNVTVNSTTIDTNSATTAGGNIATSTAGSSVVLKNSIVSNGTVDTPAPATPNDVDTSDGGSVSATFSLIKTPGTTAVDASDVTGVDPVLGALAANGGPTSTMKQAWNSPVVDTGDPAFVSPPTDDQRGLPRVAGAHVDMGAVELQPTTLSFAAATTSVAENAGNLNLQVNRTGGDGPVDVNFANTDGTATSTGSGFGVPDYSLTSVAPFHWNDNDTVAQNIVVAINDDTIYEGNENFSVTLSLPLAPPATNAAATLTPNATDTVTITDNEPQPTLSIGNVSQDEGDTGTTTFNFPVTLSAGTAVSVSVGYGTSNGTATSGDYTGASGTLNFTPAAASQTQNIPISVTTDTKHEPDETFFVTLNTPINATIATGTATGTIINDDPFSDSYWLAGSDGGVFSFGNAKFFGSLGAHPINKPIVGIAPTATRNGYWLVASDGGVFSFGDAGFFGSLGAHPINAPIVGLTPTPAGNGYWLAAADGGIFTFGDAGFFGSEGGRILTSPVVGMASTPSGNGYWLVAADGGVFAHGDAGFFGSKGSAKLNSPVIGIMATPSGKGYWLFAADGGIFTFGDATFLGSAGGKRLNQPMVGATRLADGTGYWLVAQDGGVFTYGAAEFAGSAAGIRGHAPIVGMARA